MEINIWIQYMAIITTTIVMKCQHTHAFVRHLHRHKMCQLSCIIWKGYIFHDLTNKCDKDYFMMQFDDDLKTKLLTILFAH